MAPIGRCLECGHIRALKHDHCMCCFVWWLTGNHLIRLWLTVSENPPTYK